MNRPSKLSFCKPSSARREALVLVTAPEVSTSAPRQLSFRASLLVACLLSGLLAYGGSRWVFPHFVAPVMIEGATLVLEEGEAPPEDVEKFQLVSEEVPRPPSASPEQLSLSPPPLEMPQLSTPAEIPVLDLEKAIAEAREPFPEIIPEKATPEKATPKKSRRPAQVAMRSTKPVVAARRPPKPAPVTKSARLIRRVSPVYPVSARRAGTEGRVTVMLSIGANGKVVDASISSSSGSSVLDRAALKAVRRWKFQPATVGGRPVASRIPAPVVFRLD